MKKQHQHKIAENFLSLMDLSEPMLNNFRRAMNDAIANKWKSSTVRLIMIGIENAYKNKE